MHARMHRSGSMNPLQLGARTLAPRCFGLHAHKQTPVESEQRCATLATLMPDFVTRMETTSVELLATLVSDLPGLVSLLLCLREELPGVDVSLLASRHPSLLLAYRHDLEQLQQRLAAMRCGYGGRSGGTQAAWQGREAQPVLHAMPPLCRVMR